MADATHAVSSFLGGEISQFAQGRFEEPAYRTSLKVCLNAFPVESGAWTRRPGSRYGGHARGGAKGRVIKFDFEQNSPITTEWTDGYLRFRNGSALVTTNDAQSVVAVSAANPAVVQLAAAVSWSNGNTVIFPGASTPLLENRQFVITVVDSTHVSIADAITGATINGSTLGAIASGATCARVLELQTSYVGGVWSGIRAVQAETTDFILSASTAPQVLTVTTLPATNVNPTFSLSAAVFNDGPYLDPFTNGTQVTPNLLSGIVQLTVSFPAWSATQAYGSNAFVTYSGNNYISLQDQNVGNTPGSSPLFWAATPASAAINGGKGFSGADVGRLVRLFSEPAAWSSSGSYSTGTIVSYNPNGQPGASTYWSSLVNSNTSTPGTDITKWSLVTTQGAALWTWGKITSLVNFIPGNIAGVSQIGNMVNDSAAFDGVISKPAASCAEFLFGSGGSGSVLTAISFVGQNYSLTATTGYAISSATIFPSTDFGLFNFGVSFPSASQQVLFIVNAYLFASNTPPASFSNGTLLAQQSFPVISNVFPGANITSNQSFLPASITLQSNDTSTVYKYVWIAVTVQAQTTLFAWSNAQISIALSQVEFVNAVGAGASSSGINVEILGQPLLYNTTIRQWRLGVYYGTTWPTCGCYDGGRLFLGGAQANRFDASVSNGISGNTINFAPTDPYGVVSANNAISAVFNSDDVNPIEWMIPVLEGVLMGTQAGEWMVQAPTSGPISPTNLSARRVTRIGSANVEPRRTEHTNIFVKRYGLKLMEYFADVFSGRYTAPNLAERAQHIPRTGIQEIAYTEAVTPLVWGRCTDGSLFGITYKRDSLMTSQGPTYAGWHRHVLGTGRTVESICSGPSTGGNLDALTMVTNSAANIRHVEVLTDTPDELSSLTSAWYLDDAVNPTSVSSSTTAVAGAPYGGLTINGLWHLNGSTVQVFAGGLDCGDLGDLLPPWSKTATYAIGAQVTGPDGNWYTALVKNTGINPPTDTGGNWQLGGTDYTVTNGSVFVPYGDSISGGPGRGLFTAVFATALPLTQIVVGMTYNSDGQLVRAIAPSDSGSRSGPALGLITRAHRYAMLLVNSLGLKVGTDFTKMRPANFKQADGASAWPKSQLFSGLHYETLEDNYSHTRALCWRISRPFPTTVAAASVNQSTQDQ